MGRRKFVASRQACQMFLCWLKRPLYVGWSSFLQKPDSASGSENSLGNANWIGSGRMAIDGLKEVQEAVMLIEGPQHV
jgi:capsid protein